MFKIVYNNIYFQITRTTVKTKFKQFTQYGVLDFGKK